MLRPGLARITKLDSSSRNTELNWRCGCPTLIGDLVPALGYAKRYASVEVNNPVSLSVFEMCFVPSFPLSPSRMHLQMTLSSNNLVQI